MALSEFRSLDAALFLGHRITPNGDIPFAADRLRKCEREALETILPHAQQAYINTLVYKLHIPLLDAMSQLNPITTRSDAEVFLDTVRAQHQSVHPTQERPRRMGVVALGVLRTSLDPCEREKAMQILSNKDQVALTIYQQDPDLYSGTRPAIERAEIQQLLESEDASKVEATLASLPDFHKQVWSGN